MQKGQQYTSNFNGDTIILPLSTVSMLSQSQLDNLTFIKDVDIEGDEPAPRVTKNTVKSDDTPIEKA